MHSDPGVLQILWFVLIGVLWAGFFILEGFDFGVGILVKALARDEVEKRMAIHTIGPVWDGNEVWLIVAGGAMFAAFPLWYASAFSGFYLAFFLVLAALIVRGVSFEFWGKVDSERWRSAWEWAMAIGSGGAAFLFGVAWANLVHGVRMGAGHVVHVSLLGLLGPYALLGGMTTLVLFLAHGASFLSLRVDGDLRRRAGAVDRTATPLAALLTAGFLAWTLADHGWALQTRIPALVAFIALLAATALNRADRRAAGFGASALAVGMLTATFMTSLYPDVLPSTTRAAYSLTIVGASSNHYALVVMSVVAVIFVPVVVAYQGWTYWVFRHRLGRDDYEGPLTPVAVIEHMTTGHDR
jgi:cytochrome d ubiquinol oxidase subunit II